jgi:hypothetical protein
LIGDMRQGVVVGACPMDFLVYFWRASIDRQTRRDRDRHQTLMIDGDTSPSLALKREDKPNQNYHRHALVVFLFPRAAEANARLIQSVATSNFDRDK